MADRSTQTALWHVLDRLRAESPLSGSEVPVALAALIYLRWADFQEAEQEAVAAFDDKNYEPALPAQFHWRSYCDSEADRLGSLFAQELPDVLERLGNARHSPLATQLHRVAGAARALGRLPPELLHLLISWLAVQPFETHRDRRALLSTLDSVLAGEGPRKKAPLPPGDGYGDGDYGYGDGKGGGFGDGDYGYGDGKGGGFGDGRGPTERSHRRMSGEFYTPTVVADLVAALASPAAGNHVYDPCFGSAGLLTAAHDYVLRNEKDRARRDGNEAVSISGVEINPNTYVIGLTRLALAGVVSPHLELGNSLERTPSNNPQSEGFDIVLANPPWGGKVDPSGLDHFPIRTSDSAALFIQHALSQLRPGGRAVLVVPPSILFGSGALLRLRQMLLEENTVEAVVALPARAFMPYTSVEPRILVIRRGGTTNSVRMVEVPWFEEVRNEIGHGFTHATATLLDAVRSASPGKHSWEVDVKSLAGVEFDLTPRRRDQSGLEKILNSLPAEVKVMPVAEICHVTGGRAIRSEELQDSPPKSNFEPSGQTLFPAVEREGINPQRVLEFADNPIPYIRIKDVQKGVVSKGSSWLGPVAASTIDSRWKLCAGDILLSKSGTIGKVGIVRNGAIGAIAANGFFVLRTTEGAVDPHYLLAYLQSAECNAWLDDRARGSGVRHLTMNTVKELPVPVPPLPIQQRVADQWRQFGVDALSFLAELISEDRSEPVAAAINSWIDSNLVALDRREASGATEDDLKVLEQVAGSSCPLNTCEVCGKPYFLDYDDHYIDPPHDYGKGIQTTCLACWLDVGPSTTTMESLRSASPLIDWAFAFKAGILGLRNASQIPTGVSLLNVLQSVRSKVATSMEAVKGHLPNEEKARRVTKGVLSVVESACNRLLRDVRLVFSVGSVSEIVDGVLEVELSVTNEGPLPLRDLVLSTSPALRTETVPYLAENASHRGLFSGEVPRSLPDTFTLTAKWSGQNLAGERIDGTRDIPIETARWWNAERKAPTDLGPSPYVCGDPVKTDRPDVFVGREELLDQIRRQIVQSGNVVLLEGNRRAGKSSILWHLEGKGAVPGWLGVYCSLQGTEGDNAGGVPTAEVFRGMAYEIVQSVRKLNGSAVLPDGTVLDSDKKLGIARALRQGISDEAPFADFREYVALVLDTLAEQGLGLLLMLDEFDKLQEGIDKGVTSPQVPENIRFLVQTYPKFSAILTGSRRLKRLREEYWSALFGLGTRFSVSALPPRAAERLVTEPVKGRIAYAKDALELAYTLTAGQPYLLQCLCNRIFDIAARSGSRSITVDQVREAGRALVEDNEHFASLWDYTLFDRRRFLLALVHRESRGPDPLSLGVIEEKLAGYGIEIREETLIADLDYLRELELIDLHGETSRAYYTLTIPMMGDWIERQQDFDALRSKARAEIEDSDE